MSSPRFVHTRRIEFAETDMAGMLHFSEFFRYMESAEHAFLRSLNFSVHQSQDGTVTSFVRVHAECDFRKPLFFEDEVQIELRIAKMGKKSITYNFVMTRDEDNEEYCASGQIVVVCMRSRVGDHKIETIEIPAEMRQAIEG